MESVKRMLRGKKIVQTLKEPEQPLKPRQSTAITSLSLVKRWSDQEKALSLSVHGFGILRIMHISGSG